MAKGSTFEHGGKKRLLFLLIQYLWTQFEITLIYFYYCNWLECNFRHPLQLSTLFFLIWSILKIHLSSVIGILVGGLLVTTCHCHANIRVLTLNDDLLQRGYGLLQFDRHFAIQLFRLSPILFYEPWNPTLTSNFYIVNMMQNGIATTLVLTHKSVLTGNHGDKKCMKR